MIIDCHGNGIRLLNPDSSSNKTKQHRLQDLINQSCNVYFLNKKSGIEYVNKACAELNSFASFKDAKGRVVSEYAEKDSANQTLRNDTWVVTTKQNLIIEQEFSLLCGTSYHYLTVKMPWYNESNQLLGLLGFSVAIGLQPLAQSIRQLSNVGLLTTTKQLHLPGTVIDKIYLSKRETECLQWYVKGKTAKEIGQTLGLSYRTIQHYLENVKTKLGVNSKSQLIEKAINYFYSE